MRVIISIWRCLPYAILLSLPPQICLRFWLCMHRIMVLSLPSWIFHSLRLLFFKYYFSCMKIPLLIHIRTVTIMQILTCIWKLNLHKCCAKRNSQTRYTESERERAGEKIKRKESKAFNVWLLVRRTIASHSWNKRTKCTPQVMYREKRKKVFLFEMVCNFTVLKRAFCTCVCDCTSLPLLPLAKSSFLLLFSKFWFCTLNITRFCTANAVRTICASC